MMFNKYIDKYTRFLSTEIIRRLFPEFLNVKVTRKGILKYKTKKWSFTRKISLYRLFMEEELSKRLSKLQKENNIDKRKLYSYIHFQLSISDKYDFGDIIQYYYEELRRIDKGVIILPESQKRNTITLKLFSTPIRALREPLSRMSIKEIAFWSILIKKYNFA